MLHANQDAGGVVEEDVDAAVEEWRQRPWWTTTRLLSSERK
jgi:hypothetical protein